MISNRWNLEEIRFSGLEQERYLRQIALSEIGSEGQARLASAKVLCIGVGGLGSPATMYLAAAGVGCLGLIDPDTVCRSNLHRQILFSDSDIGRSKIDAAMERLRGVNPHCELIPYANAFTPENALDIAENYDIIVDGTDNFPTRYLSNDVSVQLGIPNVYASIYKFEGQISVFDPSTGDGCYRCMFPVPPTPGLVPNCAEGGVLGVLPGIVGTLQAAEALKLILGLGEPLRGSLLHIDMLRMSFRHFHLRKDQNCPCCGTRSLKINGTDYEFECSTNVIFNEETQIKTITALQLAKKLIKQPRLLLIDVREAAEHEFSNIPGSTCIPLSIFENNTSEIERSSEVILYCASELRSRQAAQMLTNQRVVDVSVLKGGLGAWLSEVDSDLRML